MTKHPQKLDNATAPRNSVVSHGAGAPEIEIEITNEMLDAGLTAFDWHGVPIIEMSLVQEVYRAMRVLEPASVSCEQKQPSDPRKEK